MDDRRKDIRETDAARLQPESGKADRKAERKKKKAEKKAAKAERKTAKRAAKKAAYQALGRKGKILFWGRRAAALLILVLLAGIGKEALKEPFYMLQRGALAVYGTYIREVSEEEILAEAPRDEEKAAAVEAGKAYGADDTWAVYVYMCGSDLESGNVNNLSAVTRYLIRDEASASQERQSAAIRERLARFMEEIQEEGMDLPSYMYAETPMQTSGQTASGVEDAEIAGNATADITEIVSAAMSENVSVVLQTGGSSAWEMGEVNPNRSQRFLYDANGFRQIRDNHIRNMGEADTLEEFLSFCRENYPADHQILIFWDHGGGTFGFASDGLYGGDTLTLKELRQALESVCQADAEEPPFEIIGFDACLMGSVEVAETLYGYGRYLVASEELEPGLGWNYTPWLSKLSANPQMNGAQVGMEIADAGLEAIADYSIRYQGLAGNQPGTLSVVDLNGAHRVYEAYGTLMSAALKDAVEDPGTLAVLGRAAGESIKYAQNYFHVYNTIDLGLFAEALSEAYPAEAGAVLDALSDSVVYNRCTAYVAGSSGLSVYFPTDVDGMSSLARYLEYIYEVCEDEDTRALYYYKIAGCLNEELQEYVENEGYGTAKKLDSTALSELAYAGIGLGEDANFTLQIPEEAGSLIQEVSVYLTGANGNEATVLGEDDLVSVDGEGKLNTEFAGEWIAIDGHFLELEVIDSTDSVTKYRTEVLHEGKDSYLILGRNKDTGEFSILGVYSMEEEGFVGELEPRNMETVSVGDKLQPVYDVYDMETGAEQKKYGKEFTCRAGSEIGYQTLDNGDYLLFAVMYDVRGDEYYSPIVQFTLRNGSVTSASVQEEMGVSVQG